MRNSKSKTSGADPRPPKKTKVKEEDNQWDRSRVLSPEGGVPCRECQEAATVTWVANRTGDTWDLCDACQLKDFGECFKVIGHATDHEESNVCPPCEILIDSQDSEAPKSSTSSSPPISMAMEGKPFEALNTVVEDEAAPSTSDFEKPSPSESFSPSDEVLPPCVSKAQDEIAAEVSQDDNGDHEEGQFDLKKILTLEELLQEDCICCSQDACGGLPAFGLYVNSIDPQDRWYYCLDCQENDFDGWPPVQELPVKYLTPEHLRVMAQKCSSSKKPKMPVFPHSPEPNCTTVTSNPPANFVTPSIPVVLVQSKSVGPKKAIEAHKKWLEAAQSMGGKDSRIVVSKPAAKELIFDFLAKAFQPMNITQVYTVRNAQPGRDESIPALWAQPREISSLKGLKAVVPQPVLNACLQEMVPDQFTGENLFHDSDEEDTETKEDVPVKSEPYSGSLIFKPGKNLSTNLYFCDYNKVKGMDHDERIALLNDLANAKAEKGNLEASLKTTGELAGKLLREPTNEELQLKLEADEILLHELENKVAEARTFTINENHKRKTKKRIEKMAAAWRSRRRLCFDFLTSMEENSDGQISRVKALKGDGPLILESDEMIAKEALKYAQEKKAKAMNPRGLQPKLMRNLGCKSTAGGALGGSAQGPASDVVAVTLDAQLNVVRIYANCLEA